MFCGKNHGEKPQNMDFVGVAIPRVVCQKSDFHGNRDFQNSQKLDPLQITEIKNLAKKCQPFKDNLVQEIDPWCIKKLE
jgi:hypothetical protein